MKHFLFFIVVALGLSSCKDGVPALPGGQNDLDFASVTESKEYADMILKAIRTGRDKVVSEQFADGVEINKRNLDLQIKAYSQSFGKGEWEYRDEYAQAKKKNASNGYDYSWYDKRGRIAMQVNVLPENSKGKFNLKKLEFRSRIEILKSEAFPGGAINDYKEIK